MANDDVVLEIKKLRLLDGVATNFARIVALQARYPRRLTQRREDDLGPV